MFTLFNIINAAGAGLLLSSKNNNNTDMLSSMMYWEERRKEELNENFKKDFEKYLKSQINQIQYQMAPDKFQIEHYYIEEMVYFIHLITEKEKYEENLFNEVKKIVLDNAKKNKLVKHLNIILSGQTGAGKSSLINKILNLIGEKAVKTAIGVPCTMGEPKYYESETVPLL